MSQLITSRIKIVKKINIEENQNHHVILYRLYLIQKAKNEIIASM